MREEYKKYFETIETHPRMLVGQQVPKIGGAEGELETLRDTDDAREWQEAVKSVLIEEVKDRAATALEDQGSYLATLHQSIELFQNNTDLIPGTKDFDTRLANQFAQMAKPYEIRVDGKLQGYSIPVQPLVDQIRSSLKTQPRAAAPAGKAPAKTRKPAGAPQAGIPSKSGSGASDEDFSTLFGTIGLPNLKI